MKDFVDQKIRQRASMSLRALVEFGEILEGTSRLARLGVSRRICPWPNCWHGYGSGNNAILETVEHQAHGVAGR